MRTVQEAGDAKSVGEVQQFFDFEMRLGSNRLRQGVQARLGTTMSQSGVWAAREVRRELDHQMFVAPHRMYGIARRESAALRGPPMGPQ